MKWLLGLLVVLSIATVVPIIHYHYVYPTAGDDTANHLFYIANMTKLSPIYNGERLVGEALRILPVNITISFTWFHFVVFIAVLWIIGLTLAYSVNYIAGIIGVLWMLIASDLTNLFYYGQIFDIVSIGILLPLALFFMGRKNRSITCVLIGCLIALLFLNFHENGKYLWALTPVVVVYEAFRKRVSTKLKGIPHRLWHNRFLIYSGVLGAILRGLAALNVSIDPGRLAMDGSILLVMFLAGLVAMMVKERWLLNGSMKWCAASGLSLSLILVAPILIQWQQNNSALKDADKDAIEYLNTLPGQNVATSAFVAQGIYQVFVNKHLSESDKAEYLVFRTAPMTPRTDPTYSYYENKGKEHMSDAGFVLLRVFDDNERDSKGRQIAVLIYGKEHGVD